MSLEYGGECTGGSGSGKIERLAVGRPIVVQGSRPTSSLKLLSGGGAGMGWGRGGDGRRVKRNVSG